jgi:hypothetical protein
MKKAATDRDNRQSFNAAVMASGLQASSQLNAIQNAQNGQHCQHAGN